MKTACLALTLLSLSCAPDRNAAPPRAETDGYKIIGYYYGGRDAPSLRIAAQQLTHINYAFAEIQDGRVVSSRQDRDASNLARLNALKAENPDLKILISVGGWSRSEGFSDAALTEESRDVFARSAVAFMKAYGLDGVDLDWEYPGQPGAGNTYRPEDRENFTLMLQALRDHLDRQSALDRRGPDDAYLLTIATGTNAAYLEHTDLGRAQQSLDFINIMTYDFAGAWTDTVWHHTNLHASYAQGASRRGADAAVEGHRKAGVPAHKIVLGVAFYGRGWEGVEAANTGLNQPASDKTTSYAYHTLAADYIDRNGFVRYWDDESKAPYLWHAGTGTFITYDDTVSLRHKAAFIKEQDLGGAMFWEYSSDTTGTLLRTLYTHLLR